MTAADQEDRGSGESARPRILPGEISCSMDEADFLSACRNQLALSVTSIEIAERFSFAT
jgi:hypothetical protein